MRERESRERAVALVHAERDRQEAKFGDQTDPLTGRSTFEYLVILMEEVGELSECVLHERFGGPAADEILKEAVQTAAVSLAFAQYLLRRRAAPLSKSHPPPSALKAERIQETAS